MKPIPCHEIRRPLLFVLALLTAVAPGAAETIDPSDPEVQREIRDSFGPGATGAFRAKEGMVATSSHHATMAGLETLRGGGNAFDAMAVVQFVLSVAEPHASGIGGGLFIMMYDAESGEVVNIDGREEAPRAFHPDAFRDEDGEIIPYRRRTTGGNAVGVPGTLAATSYLLEHYGTLSLEEALQPAIRLARDGYRVTAPFARNLRQHRDRLRHYPESIRLFSGDDGEPLGAGDLFRNPEFAATLELIAEHGIEVFYEGELADEIVDTVRSDPHRPGVLAKEDLANYRPVRREPVSVDYRGYDVYGANMPTSGGTTLALMLNILEATDFAEKPYGSAASIHLMAEAQNLAFADRNRYMGDADFADVPVNGLLDKNYARTRAERIEPEKSLSPPLDPGKPAGAPEARSGRINVEEGLSTTHFSIVDRDRNVVSVTSTIEQHFGSALVVPGRGFLLNNELTDFDADAYDDGGNLVPNAPEGERRKRRTALGEAAETEGGKRPRSSMTPTLVLREGEPRLALGSPGGSRIIGLTLNALVNIIDHDMDPQTAVNAPRVIARNGPVELEAPLYRDRSLRESLEARGFEVSDIGASGSVQMIRITPDDWLMGAGDPRREGLAIGF